MSQSPRLSHPPRPLGAAVEERGVKLLTGPVDREWGMRVATFTDPDGHSWELAQALAE